MTCLITRNCKKNNKLFLLGVFEINKLIAFWNVSLQVLLKVNLLRSFVVFLLRSFYLEILFIFVAFTKRLPKWCCFFVFFLDFREDFKNKPATYFPFKRENLPLSFQLDVCDEWGTSCDELLMKLRQFYPFLRNKLLSICEISSSDLLVLLASAAFCLVCSDWSKSLHTNWTADRSLRFIKARSCRWKLRVLCLFQ